MGEMRNIVIVPYNPRWVVLFQQEAEKIRAVFGDELISMHHIGSTAIPGISAKPVIDIMPIVRRIETIDALNDAMVNLGYEVRGENGIVGRRYFAKGGDEHRTHHVHTYQADNPEVARHLDFRDYLIAHTEARAQYTQIKIEAAKQYPHDIIGYMAEKDAFIKATIQKASQWRALQTGPNHGQPGENQFIILETERLILRRQQTADIAPLIDLWTNLEVTRYMGGPRDRKSLQAAFEATAQVPNAERFDLWPVIEKKTGQLVGYCGLLDKDVAGRLEIELIYIMGPAVWGQGYATEIAAALQKHAFEAMSLTRLIALIEPENIASERVAAKIGLQFEKEVVRPGGAVRKLYSISVK